MVTGCRQHPSSWQNRNAGCQLICPSLLLTRSTYNIALVLIFEWAQAFFTAPTRKAIGHSQKQRTRAKGRQIKESKRLTYARSSWVKNGFGAVEMEEEFHLVELLTRKQPSLPCPPLEARVSQLKWYAVYSAALEKKKK